LIIKNVATNLFGTYTCQDLNSSEQGHSAVLTVTAINENLALNKNATQSSSYYGIDNVAGRPINAVDGNTNPYIGGNSCTHTNSELGAWWAVDLGEEKAVGRLTITNRQLNPQRLSNFYIGLTNVSPWTSAPTLAKSSICKFVVETPPAGTPKNYTCDAGTEPGRYLFVMLKNQEILTLCELEAYYY
jgi:hypothetical protein